MLRSNGIVPGRLPSGYVPVDIDVTPFDNSKTQKEGVSRTYKGYDGYAPIMAYIGTEGYLINAELREGKQHCQKNTPEFLRETIRLCKQITNEPLLVRLDSGNDAAENIGILLEEGCKFIIKRTCVVKVRKNGFPWHKNTVKISHSHVREKLSTREVIGKIFPIQQKTESKRQLRSVSDTKSQNEP